MGAEQEFDVESVNRSSRSHSIDHILELVQVHGGIGSLNQARESLRATGILGVCHGLRERIFRRIVRRRRVRCEDRRRIRPELRCKSRFVLILGHLTRETAIHARPSIVPVAADDGRHSAEGSDFIECSRLVLNHEPVDDRAPVRATCLSELFGPTGNAPST